MVLEWVKWNEGESPALEGEPSFTYLLMSDKI